MRTLTKLAAALTLAALYATGCGADDPPTINGSNPNTPQNGGGAATGGSGAGGSAVPSTQDFLNFCAQAGGAPITYSPASGTGDKVRYCTFGVASIELATFYRAAVQGLSQQAVKLLLANNGEVLGASPPGSSGASIANPASVYCAQKGGTTILYNGASGQVGGCRFSDGSEIEEWTLFRGTGAAQNAQLVGELRGIGSGPGTSSPGASAPY